MPRQRTNLSSDRCLTTTAWVPMVSEPQSERQVFCPFSPPTLTSNLNVQTLLKVLPCLSDRPAILTLIARLIL
jgi:hypothetical protein